MSIEPCICAVDPGLTGAIAFFFPSNPERVSVEDMPVIDGEVNVSALIARIRQMGATAAIVEQVGPMPTDGVVQAFKFGAAYAAAKAAVTACEVPLHLVTPSKWKRALNLAGGKEGKEAARGLAARLFPAVASEFARVKDHNRAEAALLARYGAEAFAARLKPAA